jgi:hypothetical protein
MTSVVGHITAADFTPEVRQWHSCAPAQLFHSQVIVEVADDKKNVARNIKSESRWAQGLMIWTDCDREGEHIGMEVCRIAREGNPRIIVKRAQFSNLEREYANLEFLIHKARLLTDTAIFVGRHSIREKLTSDSPTQLTHGLKSTCV